MQRLCTKLRALAFTSNPPCRRHLFHSIPTPRHITSFPHLNSYTITPRLLNAPFCQLNRVSLNAPLSLSLVQVRHVSSRERKKRRKPMTPVTSKVKKIKMKSYSSYKSRFRTMNDGNIRRWREGKRHNAHLKSKKSKRRLRKPAVVPVAYAKVMKKLNFCG